MTAPAWLQEAERHIGYHERPVNHTIFGQRYHLDGCPWCAMFVSYCFWKSGHTLPSMQPGISDGFAAVVYGMKYAKAHGCWRPSSQAEPGDIIVYGWNGPGSAPADMHTGFVLHSGKVGSTGHTIEGNRDDQVGRFTFTVGEQVVLGTINVKKLLGVTANMAAQGRPAKSVHNPAAASKTPKPQPRHRHHPHNTGPTRKQVQRRWHRLRIAWRRWVAITRRSKWWG